MKSIEIDRSKKLKDEPEKGHNRWHPDVTPILEVDQGEEVLIECRDGLGSQLSPSSTSADLLNLELGPCHPLTGPIWINGAEIGDLLEIEFVEIQPQPWAFTCIVPGLGFLSDVYTIPYLVHWDILDGWATSAQLPGVRIPGAPFMGVSGVAPSHEQLRSWTRREQSLLDRGGLVFMPGPDGAIPDTEPIASEGLRTLPPRENGGNFDVKQLTKGSKLMLSVNVAGGLYSVGDGHFSQGDGEVCISAAEMGSTVIVRFKLLKGEAKNSKVIGPRFIWQDNERADNSNKPRRYLSTMGMPIRPDGTNESGDLTLAARSALLNLINLLQEHGWNREQAYVLCSVAADLKIGNVVDVPNYVVSACIPDDIFV